MVLWETLGAHYKTLLHISLWSSSSRKKPLWLADLEFQNEKAFALDDSGLLLCVAVHHLQGVYLTEVIHELGNGQHHREVFKL
jgi:hypothetical protein